MVKIPEYQPTVDAIYESYVVGQQAKEATRESSGSLGLSGIGDPCARKLWYRFRKALPSQFKGRVLRLFETGNREEERMIRNLEAAGVLVDAVNPATGKQYHFTKLNGHISGYADGIGLGIREAPATLHLLEFKTMNERNFNKFKKDGIKKSFSQYYAQVICYMDGLGLSRCFFLAVNKNTDELYAERVYPDPVYAKQMFQKAELIITANTPLTRISDNPGWWQCKFCEYYEICHMDKCAQVHCRTCLNSEAVMGAGAPNWRCCQGGRLMDYKTQMTGCTDHLFIPDLFPGEQVDAGSDWVEYHTAGMTIRNCRNSQLFYQQYR